MGVGGAAGLWLGRHDAPPMPRTQWLQEASQALTSDAHSVDMDRALHTIDRVIELTDDWEAHVLRTRLLKQRECRSTFDGAQHALAARRPDVAAEQLSQVGPQCRLYEFAQTQLASLKRQRARSIEAVCETPARCGDFPLVDLDVP
jgi:hypothetical protein